VGSIYIFTFPNEKQYVGQTGNLKVRYLRHRNGHKALVDRAIQKYGWDNIQKTDISCSEEYLDWQEREAIKLYGTQHPDGYNLESGGNLNKHHSEATKQKMSKTRKGKSILLSDEARKRRSEIRKGKHHSDEARKKMSESHKDKKHPSGMLGKKHSIESKSKMSAALTGLQRSDETKQKISAARKGKVLSQETKSKMSGARKKWLQNKRGD
jgi:group I intron endonuclease